HGLGTAYLHYPVYRLFGSNLASSQLGREMIAALAPAFLFVATFRLFVGRWRPAFALAALAIGLTFLLKLSAILFASNGMVGLRATLPTLIPAIAFAVRPARARSALVGVGLGLALFLSTEQGLAICLAYGIVGVITAPRGPDRLAGFVETAATLAIAVATFVIALICVGGVAGMMGALRYNLRLVPMDQYWYFGAPPNTFVPSWGAGVRMVFAVRLIGAALGLAAALTITYLVRLWLAPTEESRRRSFSLAFLASYGLISCASLLGVFTPAYVQPCWRVLIIIGLVELADFAARREPDREWFGVPRGAAAAVIAGCLLTAIAIPLVPTSLSSLPHVVRDHVVRRVPFTADSMWTTTLRDGQAELDRHRSADGKPPVLWSTYAGWLEARNGLFHPSFDYIIHALGPDNRTAYVETLRAQRPALVQTVLPTYTQYEAWLENNDWAFYDELLDWYTISGTTPWSIFWERRASRAPQPAAFAAMQVPAGLMSVPLPPIPDSLASPVMLLEVDVEYDVHNPLQG
ncbi:MAG: hypothetical protein ACREBE_26730, partial [bacterium]